MSFLSSIASAVGDVVSPISGLVSGGLSLLGQNSANNTNKDIAANNNQTSIELANTAHQREVKDLEAAGLNPILSATGGSGASVPSLSSSEVQNTVGSGVSSAVQAMSALANLKQIQSQVVLNTGLAAKAAADTTLSINSARNAADTNKIIQNQIGKSASESAAAASGARSASAQADIDVASAPSQTSVMARMLNHVDRFMETLGHFNPFVSSPSARPVSSPRSLNYVGSGSTASGTLALPSY